MNKPFLIFHYTHKDRDYVEAYPIHVPWAVTYHQLPKDILYAIMICSSRNQARKEAYRLWINPSGAGFNKLKANPRTYTFK